MSKDATTFTLIIAILFGMNFCSAGRVERNNPNLDLEYTKAVRG